MKAIDYGRNGIQMAKNKKTNAMRILEQNNIDYEVTTYDTSDGKIDGVSVAHKTGKDPKLVYKTLVAKGISKEIYVFVIPVAEELDLKKAAKAASEKKVELVPVKDILKLTGYIRGGCSPIGMKKSYKTFIDSRALKLDTMIVSGGKVGIQIDIAVDSLREITGAEFENIV